jgi:hypothetical protein
MWRQGDVFIAVAEQVPSGAELKPDCVLAEGELTGHCHCIDRPGAARLYTHRSTLYLEVFAGTATVVHQEHGPITLPRGVYRVWQQREYTPQAIRTVSD